MIVPMTNEATQFMAKTLKSVKVNGSFSPEDIGARIGLSDEQSIAAARELSNAGVLVLGFDNAAQFSSEFKKAHAKAEAKGNRSKSSRRVTA
jgi:hypothetical protein